MPELVPTLSQMLDRVFEHVVDREEATPADVWTAMRAFANPRAGGSPVTGGLDLVERVYAARAKCGPKVLALGAGLAGALAADDLGGARDRLERISLALRRDAGEEAPAGTAWPDPDADPGARAGELSPTMAALLAGGGEAG